MCSRFCRARSWQHQASRLVKPHLQPKYPSSSQWTWRPLPRMSSDPGNRLLYIRWSKKSNPLYCCKASVNPESFLFLLTGTKQDPGMLNVAFFSERRHRSSLQGLSSKLRCFDHILPTLLRSSQASAERLQHTLCLAWILNSSAWLQIAPAFIQERWLTGHRPKSQQSYKPPYLFPGVPQLWF